MSEEDWPKQDDDGIKETNIVTLVQAMELLYQTHITEKETAMQRGNAIRAIAKMLKDLGHGGAIEDAEKIPWSKRMRESEIWNDEPK